jgi:hypothetical protein
MQTSTGLVGRIASADLAARWHMIRAGNFPEAQLDDSRAKIELAVERLEKRIDGDWILGAFTIADLESYAWLAGMVALVPEAFTNAPKDPRLARPDEGTGFGAQGSRRCPAPTTRSRPGRPDPKSTAGVSECELSIILTAAPRSIRRGSRCATPTSS